MIDQVAPALLVEARSKRGSPLASSPLDNSTQPVDPSRKKTEAISSGDAVRGVMFFQWPPASVVQKSALSLEVQPPCGVSSLMEQQLLIHKQQGQIARLTSQVRAIQASFKRSRRSGSEVRKVKAQGKPEQPSS